MPQFLMTGATLGTCVGRRIATLGPAGTSSEAAATALAGMLGWTQEQGSRLCPSYEQAADMVRTAQADILIVANAYSAVNAFYMDPQLHLAVVFVQDTPLYGLAVRDPQPALRNVTVATHPAPVPLVQELLPLSMQVEEVVLMPSTSSAAAAAAAGDVDIALTTEPAARRHGLRFISRTRPITMLWSAFLRAVPEPRTEIHLDPPQRSVALGPTP